MKLGIKQLRRTLLRILAARVGLAVVEPMNSPDVDEWLAEKLEADPEFLTDTIH